MEPPTLEAARRRLRRRRIASIVVLVAMDLTIIALVRLSHRGTHIAESVLFPGVGLIENHPWLAVGFVLAMLTATVLWLAWGADWLLGAIWLASLLTTIALAPAGHGGGGALRGSHEFPLVVAATAVITWLRSLAGRLPGVRRLRTACRRRQVARGTHAVGVVDTCRAASIAALATSAGAEVDVPAHRAALAEPRIRQRARRVGALARWRFTGDPLRADQAAVRTALASWGEPESGMDDEASRRVAGVVASDPGWVRPLDAALAAAAARARGASTAAFERLLVERWALRRSHRPAWWYEPLGFAAGAAPPWEHAAMTAVCRANGWIGDEDWPHLRRAVLGAAARHDGDAHDERLVAAGRVWLRHVDDDEVARIVARRSAPTDPIALALTQWAAALTDGPPPTGLDRVGTIATGRRTPSSGEEPRR